MLYTPPPFVLIATTGEAPPWRWRGDYAGDLSVGIDDFLFVIGNWGECVDVEDFLDVLSNWGSDATGWYLILDGSGPRSVYSPGSADLWPIR
jgi:hypothetical protein